jgi:hypothetical protein
MNGGEMWMGSASDPVFGANLGETVMQFHPRRICSPGPCVLHNPSEHHMREWRTNYRADRGLMERVCPHGIGHPDPDDLTWHVSQGRDYQGVHGCDGCCRG